MSLFPCLFFPMLWALEGLAKPLHHTGFAPSSRGRHERRHSPGRESSATETAEARRTAENLHAHPRSLSSPNTSSSVPHPLLVGILIGVAGTLFVLGFAYILYRIHRRSQDFRPRARIRTRPSAPLHFQHVEHFTTSAPGTPSSAGSSAGMLRVAHRRPDGSWAFTEAGERHPEPDAKQIEDPGAPPMPRRPMPPWSPAAATISTSSSLSRRDSNSIDDGSSSKTGPPPYATGYPPTSGGRPPLPTK